MKYLDYFKLSLENMNRRKLRTFITSLAISVGVMLIITLLSIGTGLEKFLFNSLAELNDITNVKVHNVEYQTSSEIEDKLATADNSEKGVDELFESKKITDDTVKSLEGRNEVNDMILKYNDEVSELIFNDKMIKEMQVSSYEDKFYLDNEKNSLEKKQAESKIMTKPLNYIVAGREICDDDVSSAMISEVFVKKTLGLENVEDILNKEVTLKSMIPTIDGNKTFETKVKIVGVIDERFYQSALVITKDVMENIKNFNTESTLTLNERGYDTIELSVKDISDIIPVTDYIQSDLGYSVDSVQNIARTLEKAFKYFKIGLGVVGLIVIVIASLGVINTMLMSVIERTKSIGVMKAVGASKKDIRNLFIVESSAIGLIGSFMGLIFSLINIYLLKGVVTSFIVSYFNITDVEIGILAESININWNITIITIIFGTILTVIAGLYPSIKASKLDPIEAIRHE